MKNFATFIFVGLLFIEKLFAFGVGRSANGNLIMEDSCENVGPQLQSMQEWTTLVDKRECTAPQINRSSEGVCSVDISHCVPQMVQKNHGLSSEHSGPNCWNTALVMRGLIPSLRESSNEEFEHFIRSPLCRELKADEQRKPGDIGSIETPLEDGRFRHTHAFIHISDELVYNKLGINIQSGFELQTYDQMHEVYPLELSGECKSDCSYPKDFSNLFHYQLYKFLTERYPDFRLPAPESVCNAVNSNRQGARSLIEMLVTEDMLGFSLDEPPVINVRRKKQEFVLDEETGELTSIDKEYIEEMPLDISSLIIQGCDRYQDKIAFIEENGGACEKYCQEPVKKFYRCDTPEEYLNRFSDRSSRFYNDLNDILMPVDCKLESYLLTNEGNLNDIKSLYTDSLNIVNQYIDQEVDDIDQLTEAEKRALAMVATRLEEVSYSLGESSVSGLGEIFELSKSYLETH